MLNILTNNVYRTCVSKLFYVLCGRASTSMSFGRTKQLQCSGNRRNVCQTKLTSSSCHLSIFILDHALHSYNYKVIIHVRNFLYRLLKDHNQPKCFARFCFDCFGDGNTRYSKQAVGTDTVQPQYCCIKIEVKRC